MTITYMRRVTSVEVQLLACNFLLCTIALLHETANAGFSDKPTYSLFQQTLGPSLYISPVTYSHQLLGPWCENITDCIPSYFYVTQWDSTSPLNVSAIVSGDSSTYCPNNDGLYRTLWYVRDANVVFCMQEYVENATYALWVSQCGISLKCGNEMDNFLAPTDRAYNNTPVLNMNGSLSMISVHNLTAFFTLDLVSFSSTPRCGSPQQCGPSGTVDYGYITLGVVLSNKDQTIFYQVIFADTRGPPSCPNNDPCSPFSYWFFTTLPTLGFSESVSNIGNPNCSCYTPGKGAKACVLLIMPRLQYVINTAAEQFGSDPTLADWFITGVYLGPGMEGSAESSLRLSAFDIRYD